MIKYSDLDVRERALLDSLKDKIVKKVLPYDQRYATKIGKAFARPPAKWDGSSKTGLASTWSRSLYECDFFVFHLKISRRQSHKGRNENA